MSDTNFPVEIGQQWPDSYPCSKCSVPTLHKFQAVETKIKDGVAKQRAILACLVCRRQCTFKAFNAEPKRAKTKADIIPADLAPDYQQQLLTRWQTEVKDKEGSAYQIGAYYPENTIVVHAKFGPMMCIGHRDGCKSDFLTSAGQKTFAMTAQVETV